MTEQEKIKIYPSASGFVTGQGVLAEYNSACPRYVVVSQGSKRADIDPIYSELGLVHEDWYAKVLGESLGRREEAITFQIEGNVWYSGRADFITNDQIVCETKASIKPDFKYKVIRQGKYKISHLAQLISYMIQFKTVHGRIIAGFYKATKSDQGKVSFELKEYRVFQVWINPEGRILVDLEDTGYSVMDQYKHTLLLAELLKTREIKDRPINHIEFNGPCFFCPLKSLCLKYDNKTIDSKELIEQGLQAINAEAPRMYKWPVKKSRSTKT